MYNHFTTEMPLNGFKFSLFTTTFVHGLTQHCLRYKLIKKTYWIIVNNFLIAQLPQIDLGRLFRVSAVATQGNPAGNKYYLKEYKLGWSNDQITWEKGVEV